MKGHKLLLFLLGCIQFSHILDFMIMMPLGPVLMKEMSLNPTQFAFLVSSYTFSAGIMGFLSAFLIDRFDRKTAMLALFLGFTVGTLWCGLTEGYWALVSARILAGAFGGVTGSLVFAIVGDAIPSDRRATAMGFVSASFSVASVVGVPLSLWLASETNWHMPFLGLAAVALATWVLFFFQAEPMRGHLAGTRREDHTPMAVLSRVASSKGQLLGLLLIGFQVLGHFTIVPLVSPYLSANVGLSNTHISIMYALGGGLTMLSNPAIGMLADRYGKRHIILVLSVLACFPVYALTNMGPNSLVLVFTITTLFFVISSGRFTPIMALITSQVDSGHRGSYMGFVSCIQQITAGVASMVAGYLTTQGPDGRLIGFERAGWLCIGFTFAALAVAWKMSSRQVPAPQPTTV